MVANKIEITARDPFGSITFARFARETSGGSTANSKAAANNRRNWTFKSYFTLFGIIEIVIIVNNNYVRFDFNATLEDNSK